MRLQHIDAIMLELNDRVFEPSKSAGALDPMDTLTSPSLADVTRGSGVALAKTRQDSGLGPTTFVFSHCFVIIVDEKFQQIPLL